MGWGETRLVVDAEGRFYSNAAYIELFSKIRITLFTLIHRDLKKGFAATGDNKIIMKNISELTRKEEKETFNVEGGYIDRTDPPTKEISDVILQMEGVSHIDVDNDKSHWIMFSKGGRNKKAKEEKTTGKKYKENSVLTKCVLTQKQPDLKTKATTPNSRQKQENPFEQKKEKAQVARFEEEIQQLQMEKHIIRPKRTSAVESRGSRSSRRSRSSSSSSSSSPRRRSRWEMERGYPGPALHRERELLYREVRQRLMPAQLDHSLQELVYSQDQLQYWDRKRYRR